MTPPELGLLIKNFSSPPRYETPMRTVALLAIALVTAGCGFGLGEDPELEDAAAWAREFKAANPEAAREIGPQCGKEIGRSPWTRDGSLALFDCIRAKAVERGLA